MRRIGLAVVVIVSLTLAPLAVEAQQAGRSTGSATSIQAKRLGACPVPF